MELYDDEDKLVHIPTVWEICGACRGNGKGHLGNRGFVITQEDQCDPDFMDSMMSGHYDQRCVECKGSGKIELPDWDAMTQETQKLIQAEYDYRALCAQEKAMGY